MPRLTVTCLFGLTLLVAGPARARPFTVCSVGFQGPEETGVFARHLGPPDFEIVDLAPVPGAASGSRAGGPWILDACRPDLRCDVVVLSGEFGGRFFGKAGFSLGLQDLEEAACEARCAGLFRAPREVFLLACNTLATKDQDQRTPREYLRVLLDHDFDQATAERVVQMRYGPVGPSFRSSLRRVFMGVPRLYGFDSVAPRGVTTAPMLERYFQKVGDYAAYLERAGRGTARNAAFLSAFAGTSAEQETGLSVSEPGAADRDLVCRLYDEDRSLADRLEIARRIMGRQDFLQFLPTMEVFLGRHPQDQMSERERELFAEMQDSAPARAEVLRLQRELEMSTVKLEVAHFARHMGWTSEEEFHRLAVDGARALLARPLTSEIVDIVCEVAKHERIGEEIRSDDLSGLAFQLAEGIRLVDCVGSTDPRVTARLVPPLESPDEPTRAWAVYALSRRLPLDEDVLLRVAARLRDESPEVRKQARWIFGAQRRLPRSVRDAVAARDPELARKIW